MQNSLAPEISGEAHNAKNVKKFLEIKPWGDSMSECSRRLWLFLGSVRGFPRKTPGQSRENCWKLFPEPQNATNVMISGTGKGKTCRESLVDTPGTLSAPSVRGVFWDRQFQSSRVFLIEWYWSMDGSSHLENPVTSLKKESRPFFLGDNRICDNSILNFPSVSSLSDYSIGGPEGYFSLAFKAFDHYRLGKMDKRSQDSLI